MAEICERILTGDIVKGVQLIQAVYPFVLEKNPE